MMLPPIGRGLLRFASPGWMLGVAVSGSLLGCGGTTNAESQASDAGAGDAATDVDAAVDPDAAADDGGSPVTDAGMEADGATPDCPLPPGDYSACSTDDDCAIAYSGCYCGPQPAYGVSASQLDQVAACEAWAAQGCMLGCMNSPWHVTQDGKEDVDGGAIQVACTPWDGGPPTCRTYLE